MKVCLSIYLLLVSLYAGVALGANPDLEANLKPFLGDWILDPATPTDLDQKTSLPCLTLMPAKTNPQIRLRFLIEPETNQFVRAGEPSIYLEQNWGSAEVPKYERAFDRAQFTGIDVNRSGVFVLGAGSIRHKAWFSKKTGALIHEVSGALGWARQTLHYDTRTSALIYEYQYTEYLAQRCVFVRP